MKKLLLLTSLLSITLATTFNIKIPTISEIKPLNQETEEVVEDVVQTDNITLTFQNVAGYFASNTYHHGYIGRSDVTYGGMYTTTFIGIDDDYDIEITPTFKLYRAYTRENTDTILKFNCTGNELITLIKMNDEVLFESVEGVCVNNGLIIVPNTPSRIVSGDELFIEWIESDTE